jgi:two-component system sensor histidine kinase RcsD
LLASRTFYLYAQDEFVHVYRATRRRYCPLKKSPVPGRWRWKFSYYPLYCPIATEHDHDGLKISMSQTETTAPSKFSLLPGSITRFFLLLIVVLLVTMGVMVQSAVNAWLKDKSYQVVDITHAVHKRIDTWRYATWQIYDNIAAAPASSSGDGLQETRLKQDVYYLEKPQRKTEALIFALTTAQRSR